MKRSKVFSFFFAAIFFIAEMASSMELKSSAFSEGEMIPLEFTGFGEDISPDLKWQDVPQGTKSFVLIMDDPDAPMGIWVHWVVYNIPGHIEILEGNMLKISVLDNGIKQGINSFKRVGYGGPYPPKGPAHRYIFKLYAVDTVLDLAPGASKDSVMRAVKGHILAEAVLMGRFAR